MELYTHQYREVTLVCPTWSMHRSTFERQPKGFIEGASKCEDLVFFQEHLSAGGTLSRVDELLMLYRLVPGSASSLTPRMDIVRVRIKYLEARVLSGVEGFMIWGAGRDGKAFYKSLSPSVRAKVRAFCDIDVKKIGAGGFIAEDGTRVPVIHFRDAKPPVVTCVAFDRTDGEFEKNLESLGLTPGVDVFFFS